MFFLRLNKKVATLVKYFRLGLKKFSNNFKIIFFCLESFSGHLKRNIFFNLNKKNSTLVKC